MQSDASVYFFYSAAKMNLLALSLILYCSIALRSILASDPQVSDTISRYACGVRKRFGVQLIHQGRTAELGQWPWHVALFHDGDYRCGGTLIDQLHVLTAAHCVIGSNMKPLEPDMISIHLGKNVLDENPEEQVQFANVSEVHVHPEFASNDIALLVLARPVQFTDYVIPICVEGIQASKDLVGQRGWVAGFGFTENGIVSNQLRTISMPVVSNSECVQSDPELFGGLISPAVFCAGDRNGTSIGQGDGGGGLYIRAGDRWELRGIASFSGITDAGGSDTSKYVGFTNVAYNYEWVKRLTAVEIE